MMTPTKMMPRHIRGDETLSAAGRGGCCISPSSAGSTPSASAGSPSVTGSSMQNLWREEWQDEPAALGTQTDALSQHDTKNIVSTSPMFDDSR